MPLSSDPAPESGRRHSQQAINPVTGFEVMVLTLPPGGESLSEPHDAGVTEHIIVISGTLELLRDGQWQRITQDESISFRADQPHGYRNPSPQALIFQDIIHYAEAADYPPPNGPERVQAVAFRRLRLYHTRFHEHLTRYVNES